MLLHHDEHLSENGGPAEHRFLPCTTLLPPLRVLITVTLSTPTGDSTHPIKEDVKKKFFSVPARDTRLVACIQPCLLTSGAFGFTAWDRRVFQRRCQPQLISLT